MSPPRRLPRRGIWLCFVLTLQLLFTGGAFAGDAAQAGYDYDKALALSQDAIGKRVGNHRFTSADGREIGIDELRGKPLVVSMIYTSCYQICPMTTRHLASVVAKAQATLGEDSFNVALVGFDTAVDNPEAMRFFAARQGVADRGWYLLSGDAKTAPVLGGFESPDVWPTMRSRNTRP